MVDDENEQILNIWSVYNTQRGSVSILALEFAPLAC